MKNIKEKQCNSCYQTSSIENFCYYKSKNYYDAKCRRCRNMYNKKYRKSNPEYTEHQRIKNKLRSREYRKLKSKNAGIMLKRQALLLEGKNICHRCKVIKDLKHFVTIKGTKRNACKMCREMLNKANKLKNTYGLSLKNFYSTLEMQNNSCKICKIKFNKSKNICVDHCHNSKRVRGLLCHSCNRGIGLLKEDKTILRRAIQYIKHSSFKTPLNGETPEMDNPVLNQQETAVNAERLEVIPNN